MLQLYRICRNVYNPQNPSGAVKTPGRWHTLGHSVLYFCSSLAMCILELKANSISFTAIREEYHFTDIEINEVNFPVEDLSKSFYVKNWNLNRKKTQDYGNDWYESLRSPILKVRSAVLPTDSNFILNTTHPDFLNINFPKPMPIPLDPR
ncbi:MAG: RES family NAD+ phosphorylase, partial [Ignavibacteriaceae bacterium]